MEHLTKHGLSQEGSAAAMRAHLIDKLHPAAEASQVPPAVAEVEQASSSSAAPRQPEQAVADALGLGPPASSPPRRRLLTKTSSCPELPPQKPSPELIQEAISRMGDVQRHELAGKQLAFEDPVAFNKMLRMAVGHLESERLRSLAKTPDTYTPRGKEEGIWKYFYLLHSEPGHAMCKKCCPIEQKRDRWSLDGIKKYGKSKQTTNLWKHAEKHGIIQEEEETKSSVPLYDGELQKKIHRPMPQKHWHH